MIPPDTQRKRVNIGVADSNKSLLRPDKFRVRFQLSQEVLGPRLCDLQCVEYIEVSFELYDVISGSNDVVFQLEMPIKATHFKF